MNNQALIRIAIADDHKMVVQLLSDAIDHYGKFKVIIQAANGKELIRQIEENTLKPDICIVDIQMPQMNGYDTAMAIKQRWPSIKILAISMLDNEYPIISMLRRGADGYLTKGQNLHEVNAALTAISTKGYYHSNIVDEQLFERAKDTEVIKLTEREKEYLALCCTPLSGIEIARTMGISGKSADHHRASLFQKLNIKSRVGLVLFAKQTGLVEA